MPYLLSRMYSILERCTRKSRNPRKPGPHKEAKTWSIQVIWLDNESHTKTYHSILKVIGFFRYASKQQVFYQKTVPADEPPWSFNLMRFVLSSVSLMQVFRKKQLNNGKIKIEERVILTGQSYLHYEYFKHM